MEKPLTAIEQIRKENETIRIASVKNLDERGLIVSDKVFKTAQGSYPKIEVSKTGEYAIFDESLQTNSLPKGWTKKDAAEAQKWGMDFYLQEVVDSPVSGAKSKAESAAEYKKWKERNASKLSVELREKLLDRPASENLFEKSWTTDDAFIKLGYAYPYDGVTPRIKEVDLVLNESETYGTTDLYFSYSGVIEMNARTDKDESIDEFATVEIGYTVKKEDGDWKLSGLFMTWDFDSDRIKQQTGVK